MFEKLRRIIRDEWESYDNSDKKMMLVMGVLTFVLILGAIGINMWEKEPAGYGYDIDIGEIPDESVNEEENKTPEEMEREKIQKIKKWEREVEIKKPNRITEKPMLDPKSSEIFTELKPLPIEKSLDGVDIIRKNSDSTYRKTTELTKEIADRLKSYECYKLTGDGKVSRVYKSFEDMYERERDNCQGYSKWFHPARIDEYKYGKVIWISSPELIYRTAQSHISVRGVIQIKYLRTNNRYNLESDKYYERDVEYLFKDTTDGRFLTKIIYLSNWKEVE